MSVSDSIISTAAKYTFLNNNNNLGPILLRFRDVRYFVRRNPRYNTLPYSSRNFRVFPLQ